jgi:hypothetical protein
MWKERAVDPAAALAFSADGLTCAAGAFNAAWLGAFRRRERRAGRRAAAGTLALLNAGIAVQAAFAQALYSAHRFGWPEAAYFSAPAWLASRALVLAGVLLISALILRTPAR